LDGRILLPLLSNGVSLGSAVSVGVGHEGQDLATLRVMEEVSWSDGSVVEMLAPLSTRTELSQILVQAVVSDGTVPKISSI
jgi:hypothetical protein